MRMTTSRKDLKMYETSPFKGRKYIYQSTLGNKMNAIYFFFLAPPSLPTLGCLHVLLLETLPFMVYERTRNASTELKQQITHNRDKETKPVFSIS